MISQTKKIFQYFFSKKSIVYTLAMFFSLIAGVALANHTPPAIYHPGETLAPTCAPGSLNCTVSVAAGSGITSLNGLTPLTQTFAVGTAGTNFNIGSVGSTHTFNFPDASATKRGLLTPADWSTFNAKISSEVDPLSLKILNNLSDLNSVSTARINLGLGTLATQNGTFSGISSGTNTGDQTITLTGDVTGSGTGSFATTISANSVALTTDTTGNYVATITAGGGLTGDVSSEGSTPTLAVGAGTGITVNPNDIAIDTASSLNWTGNEAFSGNYATPKGADFPTTGTQNDVDLGSGALFRFTGASTATFTGLAGGTDGRLIRIFNASSSTLTFKNQNIGSAAADRIITANGNDGTINPNGVVTLQYDSGASRWRITALPVEQSDFVQNGNGFGATAILGTTDAFPLNLITGGTTRLSLAAGSSTLTGTGTTTFTTNAGSTLTLDSGTTGAVNLGNSSDAKTITIGNNTGATSLNLKSGTGSILMSGLATGTSATYLGLPVKTDAGDPTTTQINGATYYNSSSNKFRCFENSSWKDCISTLAGLSLSGITSATALNTLSNGDFGQTWNWTKTTAGTDGIIFADNNISGTLGTSVIKALANSGSNAVPVHIVNIGNGNSFQIDDNTTSGGIDTTPFIVGPDGDVAIGTTDFGYASGFPARLTVLGEAGQNTTINSTGDINDFLQLNVQNVNAGTNASTDLVATADNGNQSIGYVDLGINSSGYTSTIYSPSGPNDAYLVASGGTPTPGGGDLVIGTNQAGTSIVFFTSGTTYGTERMTIKDNGLGKPLVGIGTTTPVSTLEIQAAAGIDTLRLLGSTSGYVGFKPAAAAGSTTYTLPSVDGISGDALTTNGGGVLSWVQPTGVWQRVATTISPTTAGDNITTSGNISSTGSGAITSAGLLTGSAGLTVSGATTNINASSNNITNINTGTSTGAVNVGNSLAGAIGLTSGSGLTFTGGAASSFNTTAGNITLQPAGSGTIGKVQIGAGGAGSTTPDFLALDSFTTSGADPAGGAEGYMYYNTADNKFRCFVGASWTDCDTAGVTVALQNAYNNGATISTSGSNIAFTLNTTDQFTVSGAGAVNLTPTSASSFTSGGALTFTGGAASTWGTSTGDLTLQAAGTGSANIKIGGNAGTTPDFLVLDNNTFPAEGSGTNGAMYYSTTLNSFRCYVAGGWQDCGATAASATTLQQAYIAGNTITTSAPEGNFNVTGTEAVNLTPTTASQFTSGGALTFTGGAASTWSTSSGALSIDSAAALNLGNTNATSVSLGRTGVTTTNNGALTSTQTLTASNGLTLTGGALNLTATSGGFSISGLGASSISSGANSFALVGAPVNINTTGTGSTNIGNATGVISLTGAVNLPGLTASKVVFTDGSDNLTSTGTVGIAQGGTGQTTASAAFNALSPITTKGDLVVGNGVNSAARLPVGTDGLFLTADSTQATGIKWSTASVPLNSLDFSDFKNAMTVDASTSIGFGAAARSLSFNNDGTGNEVHNLSSTGDFVIQDAGTTFASFNDDGSIALGKSGVAGTTTINSTAISLAGATTDINSTGTLGLNTTSNQAITTGTGLFTTGDGLTVNGAFTAVGNFATPKGADYVTTGTTNNVNFGNGSLFHYAGVAPATITGIAGGTDGRLIRINNTSGSNLTFTNLDAGSSAANQIVTPGGVNIVIAPEVTVQFQYDSGTATWHVVTLPATPSSIGGFAFVQGGNAFGTTATLGTTDAFPLNLITGGSTRFALSAGSATLTGTGATTLAGGTTLALTSAAGSALNVTSGTTGALTLDSGTTGTINIGTGTSGKTINVGTDNTTADTINIGSALDALTISSTGLKVSTAGALTGVASIDTIGTSATALTFAGAGAVATGAGTNLTLDAGTTGAVNIAGTSTGDINIGGGSGSTGCTVTNSTGALACSGAITTTATSGNQGWWNRTGTTLSPVTAGDIITTSGNISSTGTGTITSAGLLTGSAGLIVSGGTANINVAGTSNTSIGNATGTLALTSSGGLNATTAGALTGVASIDTIAHSATAITFAGAGTISSTTTSAITLDSGTGGIVNLGTGNNSKTINVGTGTAGDTINIGTDNTTADTIAIGSNLDSLVLTGANWSVASGGLITTAGDIAVNGSDITTTGVGTATVFNTNALTLNMGGAATAINIGPTGSGAGSIVFAGGSADTGCTINDATGALACSGAITGSNTSGTNTGDITLAAIGATPNANGATLTAQALNLEPASASFGGVVTTGVQTLAGAKTFSSLLTGSAGLTVSGGTANINVAGTSNTAIGNATGTFALISSGGLNATTAGALTGVASIDTIAHSATAITFAGAGAVSSTGANALSVDGGASGALNLNNNSTGDILIGGGSGSTGCTVTNSTGALACSGAITTTATSGNQGWWNRTGTTLSPATAGDIITTSGNISATGTGTITSAGLLTASNGLTQTTGALNLTATSGALTLSGLSASSVSAGANALTFTSSNFNTTATGINSTAIGATTASTGKFSTLTSTGATDLANAGASNVTIATTGTGNVTIGNATGTFALASSGGLNVTTVGSLTGVGSIDTIATSATALTFAGTGTLDSGSATALNLGTGASARTITLGNVTGATALNLKAGTGSIIMSGQATGTSATYLGLPVKTDAGDPTTTQINGAMYYNSSSGKFRCYQASAWTDCITASTGSNASAATVRDTTSEVLGNGVGAIADLITAAEPSIAPDTTSTRIMVTGWAKVTAPSPGSDTEISTINVWRNTTDNNTCDGTQVGANMTVQTTASGENKYVTLSFIDSPASTSAQFYTVCGYTNTATTPNLTPDVTLTIQEVAAAGADVAEIYSTNDGSLEAGDVVSIDSSLHAGVKKSEGANDKQVVGVVSTYPAMVIGEPQDETVAIVPVALSGRVPIKVVKENGAISPGDYLTPSSTPGVAMKSNGVGIIIGQAMSSYDSDGVGTVTAFVKNFELGGGSVLMGDISKTDGLSTLVTDIQAEVAHNPIAIITQKITDGKQFLTDFIAARVTAIRGYFDEIFTNTIHQKTLCVGDTGNETCITKTQLDALLHNANIDPTSTCTPPKTLVNNVCTDPINPPTCVPPQTLVNNVCTDPINPPTCVPPQTLVNNVCTNPVVPPTCTAPQVLDTTTNTCVTPAPVVPTCTLPQVLDTTTNTCVTPPPPAPIPAPDPTPPVTP